MALPSWDLAVVIGPQAGLNEKTRACLAHGVRNLRLELVKAVCVTRAYH